MLGERGGVYLQDGTPLPRLLYLFACCSTCTGDSYLPDCGRAEHYTAKQANPKDAQDEMSRTLMIEVKDVVEFEWKKWQEAKDKSFVDVAIGKVKEALDTFTSNVATGIGEFTVSEADKARYEESVLGVVIL